jgi:hypothetical protein
MLTHEHQWGNWTQTTAATCTAAGEETRVCEKNEENKDARPIAIDPQAHNWGAWTQTKAPTTTAEGEETRTCSNDAVHKETRAIAKLPVTSANLSAHLAALPVNTVSTPHTVALRVSNTSEFTTIKNVLNGAPTKYVNLDLTGSTITSIPEFAFNIGVSPYTGCATLIGVTIPNGVTSIEYGAFGYCNNLSNINFPNGLTSIGQYAFEGAGLTSITIPNSVTIIVEGAFLLCEKLTSITIPNGVTSIGYGAFGRCTSLTSVSIGNSVTSIGEFAFNHCTSLTSVTFAGTIPSSGFGNNAFQILGDLRDKFYATNPTNGTPGTYTRASGGTVWTRQ